MKTIILLTFLLLFLSNSGLSQSNIQTTAIEDGWKGIKVFKTNRTEVEEILGKPSEEKAGTYYRTEDAFVRVIYSDTPCSNTTTVYGKYKLEKGTVLKYSVDLLKAVNLSDLIWNKDDYECNKNRYISGLARCANLRVGLKFDVFTKDENPETADFFDFLPTKEQVDYFRCGKDD